MADRVRKQFANPDSATVEIIPNWGQINEFAPGDKKANSFAIGQRLVDKLTVLYAGNIGSTHGVEKIIWIADQLREDAALSFLIVGDGLGLPKVLSEIARLDVANVTVLPRQPWAIVPDMLAAAEIAVVMQEKGTEVLSMPSKTYSSMAAGSAILAMTSPMSDLAHVVKRYQIGMVCDQDDIACAVSSLRTLKRDSSRLEEIRRRSRQTVVDAFSEEVIYRQWLQCLGELVNHEGDDSRETAGRIDT